MGRAAFPVVLWSWYVLCLFSLLLTFLLGLEIFLGLEVERVG